MTHIDPETAAQWIAAEHVDYLRRRGASYRVIIESVGARPRQVNRAKAIEACATAWQELRDADSIMAVANGEAEQAERRTLA